MASLAPIAPLPPQVVAQIRSSTSITSLNGVIIELVKNSLDAEATEIEIRVFRNRGGCMVQDDGLGIAPSEFETQGGLAKPHHTSKHAKSQRPTHGTDGCFLASLCALSLVKIASKHFKHHSQNSITLTGGVAASRHIPARPEERIPGVATSGTRVCVYNLFGNMPVRVKQRSIEASDASLNLKERQNLRKEVAALLLFWHKHVLVTIKGDSGNPIRISNLRTNKRAWHTRLPVEQVFHVLYEAGFLPSIDPSIWKSVTGKTSSFQLEGGICLEPAPTKNIQFLSFGIKPMLDDGRRNIIFEEINRLFANSLFGMKDELHELDEEEKRRRARDRRFKTDGYTTKELKSSGKGVDRWPMFAMRIDVKDRWSMKSPDDLFEDDNALASITNLIQGVVVGFLEEYHFMPKQVPNLELSRKRDRYGNLVKPQDFQPQPRNFTDDSPRQRGFPQPGTSTVSPSMQPSRSEVPNYTVDSSIPRTGSPFDVWARVKSGRTINAPAVPKPAFPAQVDSSPASKSHPIFPFLTTRPAAPFSSSCCNLPQVNRLPSTHFHPPFPPNTRTPPHPITSSHFSPPHVDRAAVSHQPPVPSHMRTPATPTTSWDVAPPDSVVSKEGQVLRLPFLNVERASASRADSLRPRRPAEIITGTHQSDKAPFSAFKESSWQVRQMELNEAGIGPSKTHRGPPLPTPTHRLSAAVIAPKRAIIASTTATPKAVPPSSDHIKPQNQTAKTTNLLKTTTSLHARKDSATWAPSTPKSVPPPEDHTQPQTLPSQTNNLPDLNAPSWEDTFRRQLFTSPRKTKKDEVQKDEIQKYTDSRGRESYINTRTGQTMMLPRDPKTGRIKSKPRGVRSIGYSERLTKRLLGPRTHETPHGEQDGEKTKTTEPLWFVESVLQTYNNTAFKPVKEPPIPIVANQSTADPATHAVLHGHKHNCSEVDIQKAFKSSSGVSGEIGRLSKEGLRNAKVVKQVDDKFILITVPEAKRDLLVLVDQHAADERIRIEALMTDYFTPPAADVMFPRYGAPAELLRPGVKVEVLQTPIMFETTAVEAEALMAKQTWFARWGVVVMARGHKMSSAVVRALPTGIVQRCRVEPKLAIDLVRRELYASVDGPATSVLTARNASETESRETMDWLERLHCCPQGILDMLNSRACRSAIMFNDELNFTECQELIGKLAQTKFPFICAHGRPSMVPLAEVEGLGGYEDEKEFSWKVAKENEDDVEK